MKTTRRGAIARLTSATAGLLGSALVDRLAAQQPCGDNGAAGTLLGTLPLSRPDGVIQPFGVKFGGAGLDARQVTDLSGLRADRLITPNQLAFVRTECPPAVARRRGPWSIATTGLVGREG